MKKNIIVLNPLTFSFFLFIITLFTHSQNDDASVMLSLKRNINPPASLGWSDPDPCKWTHVSCSGDNRVTRIQIGRQNLHGTIPRSLNNLTELQHLELQFNNFSGPLPSLNGLNSLQVFMASSNRFTVIPGDFFAGMSQLVSVEIDDNPFEPWEIPVSLKDASSLQNFSANNANVKGKLPDFLGDDVFPVLTLLHLAFNNLEGVLPKSFSGLKVESLWLNGQKSDGKLTGSVEVLQNMTSLTEVWLHSNAFSGPLPSFEGLKDLEVLSLRDNSFTGVVPSSLVSLKSLKVVNLTNNLFQGPVPGFGAGIVATTLIAICPGYISRSVAGSYDNEGVAIFVLLLTFYLFVKAVNTGSLSWSLASAFGYFYMVSAWGGYVFIINLVPLYVLVLLVTGRYSLRLYVAYNCMYVLGMLLAMQIRFVGFQHVQSGEHMASMGVFFLLQMPYTFFQL